MNFVAYVHMCSYKIYKHTISEACLKEINLKQNSRISKVTCKYNLDNLCIIILTLRHMYIHTKKHFISKDMM